MNWNYATYLFKTRDNAIVYFLNQLKLKVKVRRSKILWICWVDQVNLEDN